MVVSAQNSAVCCAENGKEYDRETELRAFDDTKAGVKGLVDAGVTKIPSFFNCKQFGFNENTPITEQSQFTIPVIDLEGIGTDSVRRAEVVERIRDASKQWGFFQILNHGIPTRLLDEMIDGMRRFHEQDTEAKKEFYTRDLTKKVMYMSNFDLFQAPAANWRDTFVCFMEPNPPDPNELPAVCRDILIDYTKQVKQLGLVLLEVISEALGLKSNYLEEMGCAEKLIVGGQYYPPCPEPELTLGATGHCDDSFLTILLQDNIGGLQVLYQNQWVDIPPLDGALIINFGDILQLVSNDRCISVNHRVLSKREGPRISAVCFFKPEYTVENRSAKLYGPIPELVSEANPAVYRQIKIKEYKEYYFRKGLDGTSTLAPFKVGWIDRSLLGTINNK